MQTKQACHKVRNKNGSFFFFFFFFFFLIFVIVIGEFLDTLSVCEKEPFVWRCSFLKEGIYTAENAMKLTKLD